MWELLLNSKIKKSRQIIVNKETHSPYDVNSSKHVFDWNQNKVILKYAIAQIDNVLFKLKLFIESAHQSDSVCEWQEEHFFNHLQNIWKLRRITGVCKKSSKLCTSLSIIFSAWCVHDAPQRLASTFAQLICRRMFESWRSKRVQIQWRAKSRETDPRDLQAKRALKELSVLLKSHLQMQPVLRANFDTCPYGSESILSQWKICARVSGRWCWCLWRNLRNFFASNLEIKRQSRLRTDKRGKGSLASTCTSLESMHLLLMYRYLAQKSIPQTFESSLECISSPA